MRDGAARKDNFALTRSAAQGTAAQQRGPITKKRKRKSSAKKLARDARAERRAKPPSEVKLAAPHHEGKFFSFANGPRPSPLHQWVGKQNENFIPKDGKLLKQTEHKRSHPEGLLLVSDKSGRQLIIVPEEQQKALIMQEHESLLHLGGRRVGKHLMRAYFWPKMELDIQKQCKACHVCAVSTKRRKNLSMQFEQANKDDLPLPRQHYGIDFYSHHDSEILVAIDLCTREVLLWFLPNRKQDNVARALLSGLIFQKGVPLQFRSDEASEFVDGVVGAMNRYLDISQISTGGHNPRSNAVVERFMQHLNGCLTKCKAEEYKNIKIIFRRSHSLIIRPSIL
jgi:hypothetical protein